MGERARGKAELWGDGAALSMAGVSHWIFDLDNTLYPEATKLFLQIDERIKAFISELLDVGDDAAYRVQKEYLVEYGTTLRGLMERHDIAPHDFLEYVHDVDLEVIPPDPRLVASLRRLPGAKYIFTNGSRAHAEAVLGRLGAEREITEIFDIETADFLPKPAPQTYAALVGHFDIEPDRAVIIEDMVRNLKPAHDMGMTTVWLNSGGEWGKIGYDSAHVDIEINDLTVWLDGLVAAFDDPDGAI
jgi:putative hydrolase of the HAD superfamily